MSGWYVQSFTVPEGWRGGGAKTSLKVKGRVGSQLICSHELHKSLDSIWAWWCAIFSSTSQQERERVKCGVFKIRRKRGQHGYGSRVSKSPRRMRERETRNESVPDVVVHQRRPSATAPRGKSEWVTPHTDWEITARTLQGRGTLLPSIHWVNEWFTCMGKPSAS